MESCDPLKCLYVSRVIHALKIYSDWTEAVTLNTSANANVNTHNNNTHNKHELNIKLCSAIPEYAQPVLLMNDEAHIIQNHLHCVENNHSAVVEDDDDNENDSSDGNDHNHNHNHNHERRVVYPDLDKIKLQIRTETNSVCSQNTCHHLLRNNRNIEDTNDLLLHDLYLNSENATDLFFQQELDKIHSFLMHFEQFRGDVVIAMAVQDTQTHTDADTNTNTDEIEDNANNNHHHNNNNSGNDNNAHGTTTTAAETADSTANSTPNSGNNTALKANVRSTPKFCRQKSLYGARIATSINSRFVTQLSSDLNRNNNNSNNSNNSNNVEEEEAMNQKFIFDYDTGHHQTINSVTNLLSPSVTHAFKTPKTGRMNNKKSKFSVGMYSFSKRFYYWNVFAFKTQNDRFNGGQFQDWYVAQTFENFKVEQTKNHTSPITLEYWAEEYVRAARWVSAVYGKQLTCVEDMDGDYNIVLGTPVHIDLILCILIYCNTNDTQKAFTATFRKQSEDEPLEHWKERNSVFYWWSRLMREMVECYGTKLDPKNRKQKIYHGISVRLVFADTVTTLCGPTSTTTSMHVANRFGGHGSGIILEIGCHDAYENPRYFDCIVLSNFQNEAERLFIGGHHPIRICSIRMGVADYSVHVKAITTMERVIDKDFAATKQIRPAVEHKMCAFANMKFQEYGDISTAVEMDDDDDEKEEKESESESESEDDENALHRGEEDVNADFMYMCDLFNCCCNKYSTITINMEHMRKQYSGIQHLFAIANSNPRKSVINIENCMKLFNNCNKIWIRKLFLNKNAINTILESISLHNNNDNNNSNNTNAMARLLSGLKEIRIEKAIEDHMGYLDVEEQFQSTFARNLWHLKCNTIDEQQVLSISRIGREFTFHQDFDCNGLLYFLGMNGGQNDEYSNPGYFDEQKIENGLNLVKITSNTSVDRKSISPLWSLSGRRIVKCITKSLHSAWIAINLGPVSLHPTHYSFRHWCGSNEQALRSWQFEGSDDDGQSWQIIDARVNDESLSERGQSHTWQIDPAFHASPETAHIYFSQFRISMTDVNSSRSWSIALCGVELYGRSKGGIVAQFASAKYNQEIDNAHFYMEEEEHARSQHSKTIKTFVYESDFDVNGILYYIGSKMQSPSPSQAHWQNPGLSGDVSVQWSSLMQDSCPGISVFGRDTVRCVSKNEKRSWFVIKFAPLLICPTQYTLRHYISWTKEALRNWKIEGSNDGYNWKLLSEHRNAPELQGKGSTHTWRMTEANHSFFAQFKLSQTARNSGNHYYLACSGFEIYGDLRETVDDNQQLLNNRNFKTKVFEYESDFDKHGVMYYLGTDRGKPNARWQNPYRRGLVNIESSSLGNNAQISAVVGRIPARCTTAKRKNGWFVIDLKELHVIPTAYTLRHYNSFSSECLRNWRLEGCTAADTTNVLNNNDNNNNNNNSVQQYNWQIIKVHTNDDSLSGKGSAHTWRLNPKKRRNCAFSKFRIFQYGLNSSKHNYLALSGFEIYGTLVFNYSQFTSNSCTFHYSYDLDTHGLFHFLGMNGGANTVWANPMDLGLVSVTSSSLMADAQPLSAICGRSAVRCVTKSKANSWIEINLKNVSIKLSHYTLRHYTSWDKEALRNWVLEGRQNNRATKPAGAWETIMTHCDDRNLNQLGQMHTWAIPNCMKFYSRLRIYQTGRNSNNHLYLACSGMELYGTAKGGIVSQSAKAFVFPVQAGDGTHHPASTDGQSAAATAFVYQSDFDKNGVLYYLGSGCNAQAWVNPGQSAVIHCTASSIGSRSTPAFGCVGRSTVRCVTNSVANSWFMIDCKDYAVSVTQYSLRHYVSWDKEALRTWNFEGSLDGEQYTLLKQHRNDTALAKIGATHTWTVTHGTDSYFTKFRILQTGINSNKHKYLAMSGFEIYGFVVRSDPYLQFASNDANAVRKSAGLVVFPGLNVVSNPNKNKKFRSVLTSQCLDFKNERKVEFSILVENVSGNPSNKSRFVFGIAPQGYNCSAKNQWQCSQAMWSYVSCSGGKRYQTMKSVPYGIKWGLSAGQVITCIANADTNTIEFVVNNESQAVAFTNFDSLDNRKHFVAVSMSGENSMLRLCQRISPMTAFVPMTSRNNNNNSVE